MTAWSLESYLTGKTDLPLDVIRLVQDLITKGYLPFIHTLDLQLVPNLSTFCNHDAKYPEDIKRFNQLGKEVAAQLKDKCPWLRVYILKGFASDLFEPWFERSDILQALGITTLTYWLGSYIYHSCGEKLFRQISLLAPSLHTLELRSSASWPSPASLIFRLELPFSRSLSLTWFVRSDVAQSMAFFERRPNIEYLNILTNNVDRFTSELPQNFLPNLQDLRAKWGDVQLLTPILNQLFSLSVHEVDVEITPRCFLPGKYPNLKILDIGEMDYPETASDSGFMSEIFFPSFHYSYRSKLGGTWVPSFPLLPARLDDLNSFPHLKHLYYDEDDLRTSTRELMTFIRDLAEAVQGLVSITNLVIVNRPYLTLRVARKVSDIEIGRGSGMKVHYDVDFPWINNTGV